MPDVTPFTGLRGTLDFVTDQRPKNYREAMLMLYPNGDAPLTAMRAAMKSEKTDDPEFIYWTKKFPDQQMAIVEVYTNVGLSAAVAAVGQVAGAVVYVKGSATAATAEREVKNFRVGHQVCFRLTTDPTMLCVGKVVDRVINGASSYVAVKLLETDNNSTAGTPSHLGDCNVLQIIGSMNPEGGTIPNAITYDPAKVNNYTQIFRTPLEVTRTAQRTRLRTPDAYREAKREAMEMHMVEMEYASIFGIKTENTGDNGKPERTTEGMVPFIRDNVAANFVVFSGTWATAGEAWLDDNLELVFRFAENLMCFAGSEALKNIAKIVKTSGTINLQPTSTQYGTKFKEWLTSFGNLHIRTHPLLTNRAADRKSMLIFSPDCCVERPLDNTFFKADKGEREGGQIGFDGLKEEFLTETGFEWHYPEKMLYLTNVGG